MTTRAAIAATLLWPALLILACRAPGDTTADAGPARSAATPATVAASNTTVTAKQLADTHWRLVEFQSMDDASGTVRPSDPALYTMQLNSDGTVALRLNCNHASGKWSAEPGADSTSGSFAFGSLAVTRARCAPPSMDEDIAKHAQYVRSYLLKDGRLYLSLMADGGIYVWEPDAGQQAATAVPAAPEQGGPRYWQVAGVRPLQLREQRSATAKVLTRYAPGTILHNLGCQRAQGGVWCDVQEFGGGPRGFVSPEGIKPAISPNGGVLSGPNDSALRAGQDKFDATGEIPCARYAGQPMMRCTFGVARAGGGDATVAIKFHDGHKRFIFFSLGKPVGADTSEAEGHPEFRATKESDLNLIRVGKERYEIPDAVALGG